MVQRKLRFPKAVPIAAYDKMTKLTVRELGLLDLNEHPFHISADPRFLYLTEQHKSALSRLENTSYQSPKTRKESRPDHR